jgi:two-component system OmpR family sensor kinase
VTFRARLTLRWTVTFGLLLAVTLAAIYAGSRTFAWRDLDEQLRTLAATELASALDEGRGPHLHDFPVEALGTADFTGKFAQLYTAGGELLAQSRTLEGAGFRVAPDAIAEALRGGAPLAGATVGGRPARVAILRAVTGADHLVVAVGVYTDGLHAHLRRLAALLGAVWLIGVTLTAALGYALASRALAPIERITQRAAAVARGDFAARLDAPLADDEIGRMTRLLNEMLERLHGAVEASRRFAADASHELRSPLTAMAGEIDVTLKRHRSAEEYRETLHVVRERLDEFATLCENLMLLARAQEHGRDADLKEVALTPLVEAAAARLATLAATRRVRIRLDAFPDAVAYAEPRLLARVVENLLANAVQYNRDGGEVVVRGRVEEAAPDGWRPCTVVFTVSDTGPGIPRDEWERIFERFRRLDVSRSRRTGGAGLGLSICQAIVTLCRGSIRVADSSDRGTTFEVRLPGRCERPGTRSTQLIPGPGAVARQAGTSPDQPN